MQPFVTFIQLVLKMHHYNHKHCHSFLWQYNLLLDESTTLIQLSVARIHVVAFCLLAFINKATINTQYIFSHRYVLVSFVIDLGGKLLNFSLFLSPPSPHSFSRSLPLSFSCLEILRGDYFWHAPDDMLEIEPWLATCKTSILSTVLFSLALHFFRTCRGGFQSVNSTSVPPTVCHVLVTFGII